MGKNKSGQEILDEYYRKTFIAENKDFLISLVVVSIIVLIIIVYILIKLFL